MSFTQEKRKKILKCDGCRKHCDIGTEQTTDKKFIPTIRGSVIASYIDKDGKMIHVKPNGSKYIAIKLGFTISELCDRHR